MDGQKAFDVDYSAMTDLSNKLAIKAGSWKELNEVTDVYIKDFRRLSKPPSTRFPARLWTLEALPLKAQQCVWIRPR